MYIHIEIAKHIEISDDVYGSLNTCYTTRLQMKLIARWTSQIKNKIKTERVPVADDRREYKRFDSINKLTH